MYRSDKGSTIVYLQLTIVSRTLAPTSPLRNIAMAKAGAGAGGLEVGIHSSQQDLQESAHVTLLNNCLEFN